jgi:hypothetical protein
MLAEADYRSAFITICATGLPLCSPISINPRLSITGPGHGNPQLLSSKRPVNCVLDCGDRILFGFGLAHLNYFRLAQQY